MTKDEAWSNTRPWYTIDELNAWAEKYQNQQWHKAAIRLGEELASVGPVGYYDMDAKEWLDWAMSTVQTRTWVGLTKMELIKCGVFPWGNSYRLYEAIEDKLKQKNT